MKQTPVCASGFLWYCPGCWRWWTGWHLLTAMGMVANFFHMPVIVFSPRSFDENGFPHIRNWLSVNVDRVRAAEWAVFASAHAANQLNADEQARYRQRMELWLQLHPEEAAK